MRWIREPRAEGGRGRRGPAEMTADVPCDSAALGLGCPPVRTHGVVLLFCPGEALLDVWKQGRGEFGRSS